ncbi:hypothetical protein BJY00DRAFT_273497 [Aspergillus carlsbadensis]|nr:hypothetical protein BJY00DRAFT_273497 [Aspergillus carlsbadensis]
MSLAGETIGQLHKDKGGHVTETTYSPKSEKPTRSLSEPESPLKSGPSSTLANQIND